MKPIKYREIIKKVRKLGFVFRRNTGGTHEIWWNDERRKTCVIPHHHEIVPGTLKNILRQMGVSESEFQRL